MHVQTTLRPRLLLGLGSALSLTLVPACGGGGGGGSGSSSRFVVTEVSNGFGKLLPYQISLRDSLGQPTGELIEITRIEGKWKTSQNQPADAREGVVRGLTGRGDDASHAMAELVAATLRARA